MSETLNQLDPISDQNSQQAQTAEERYSEARDNVREAVLFAAKAANTATFKDDGISYDHSAQRVDMPQAATSDALVGIVAPELETGEIGTNQNYKAFSREVTGTYRTPLTEEIGAHRPLTVHRELPGGGYYVGKLTGERQARATQIIARRAAQKIVAATVEYSRKNADNPPTIK